jgi:hypothetical protein
MPNFGKIGATDMREVPIFLVPDERIELPTNGLQNRCSTAELIRLARHIDHIERVWESASWRKAQWPGGAGIMPGAPRFWASRMLNFMPLPMIMSPGR